MDFSQQTFEKTDHLLARYEEKEKALLSLFRDLETPSRLYEKLIEMGRSLPQGPPEIETEDRLVLGCQSRVHIASSMDREGKVFYQIRSDALISAGLASLLLAIYQGECAPFILSVPPAFIGKIGLKSALSPGRSNGLAGMHLRLKQEALRLLYKRGPKGVDP